jgi:hypothetical protein
MNDKYVEKLLSYGELWTRTEWDIQKYNEYKRPDVWWYKSYPADNKKLFYLSTLLRLLNYESDRYNFTKACELYPSIVSMIGTHIVPIVSKYLSQKRTKVNYILKFTRRRRFNSIIQNRHSNPEHVELLLNMNKIAQDSVQFLNSIGIQVYSNSIDNHYNEKYSEFMLNNHIDYPKCDGMMESQRKILWDHSNRFQYDYTYDKFWEIPLIKLEYKLLPTKHLYFCVGECDCFED